MTTRTEQDELDRDEWIARQVAELPPLTDEQVHRVARLLAPYATPENTTPTTEE